MTTVLGSRLRDARLRYGMSQSELARRVGISNQAMNEIEMGGTQDPRWSVVAGIAAVLGLSLDALAQPEPEKKKRARKAVSVG